MPKDIIPDLGVSKANAIVKVKVLDPKPYHSDAVHLLEDGNVMSIHISTHKGDAYRKVTLGGSLSDISTTVQEILNTKNGLTRSDITTAVNEAVTLTDGLTITEATAAIDTYLLTAPDLSTKVIDYINTFKADLVTLLDLEAALNAKIVELSGVSVAERPLLITNVLADYTLSTVKLQTIKDAILASSVAMANYTSGIDFNYDLEFHRLTAPGENLMNNKGTFTRDEYPAPMVPNYSRLYSSLGQLFTPIPVIPADPVPTTDPIAASLLQTWLDIHPTLDIRKILPFYILKIEITDPVIGPGNYYPHLIFYKQIGGSNSLMGAQWIHAESTGFIWEHEATVTHQVPTGYGYNIIHNTPSPAIGDTVYLAVPYISYSGATIQREDHIGPQ